MTQTFFFTSAAIGLKELMDTLFVYYIFRHRLRFPALAVAVFYAFLFFAEIGFCLWRGELPTIRELYAFSIFRGLTVFAFLREKPAKIFFAFSFIAYANVLKNNVTLTLAHYYQVPLVPEQTASVLSIVFSLLMLYPLFYIGRYFGEYLERATSTQLLAIATTITYSLLAAIATQADFGRVFDVEHFVVRFLIMTPGLLFLGVMLYLLQQLDTNKRLSQSVAGLQALYEREHDYYGQVLQHREEAAQLQESVRSDTEYTLGLLEAGDYRGLEEHFNSMLSSAESLRHINLCGHQVVDSVVGYWQLRSWESGIRFSADIRVSSIYIEDLDLAIVLGNTLENAYRAAGEPGVESPYISLKLVSQSNLLILTVENSFSGEYVVRDGQYYSAKHGFAQPGTGISNVLLVVERYDGYSKIVPQGETFLVRLALTNRRAV